MLAVVDEGGDKGRQERESSQKILQICVNFIKRRIKTNISKFSDKKKKKSLINTRLSLKNR